MKEKKMLFWTVGLIIMSFVLTTGVSVKSLNTVIEGNDRELSKVLTSKVYDSINKKLAEPIFVAQTMANDNYLIEPLKSGDFPAEEEKKLIAYLRKISSTMNFSGAFLVSEKSRAYYTQEGFNKIVSPETDSHDVWYSRFVRNGSKYDLDVDTDEVHDDVWTVFVNSRIIGEGGELLGVCGVSVVMTDLQDILCNYEEEYHIKINLIDRNGLVQVDTDMTNIENAVLDIDTSDIPNSMDYAYRETDDGGYRVSKYLENLDWYLVVQSDGSGNGQIYSNLIQKNVVIFMLILSVCIFFVSSNINSERKKMRERALERERYAKEQETLRAQAEEASRAKGEFLANMSHEIRTPINAVLGMDEMILRESREQKITEYAADIKRAGNTLLSLINDILDFSKIESGRMMINPGGYDLGTMLVELVDMLRPRAEKKGLVLELKVEPDTPAHLYGDEVRIRQIITNILTNAVKYTSEGKVTLTVSGEKTQEGDIQLYVSVKDTGIGIKEEDKERLFDSFQRVDECRNRNIEGTGLGLTITTRLLGLMGSRLEVESIYGVGSDFHFCLKQKVLDDRCIGKIQKYYEADGGNIRDVAKQFYAPDARILVVDDNEMNLKVFLGLLKKHGMQIDTAVCGKDCLSMVEQKSYHIIFMDHLMPEMDGVETLQQIRKMEHNMSKHAVIIALTANAVSGAREMFLEKGFDDYLSKPIIAAKLEKMIEDNLPEGLVCKRGPERPMQTAIVDWEKGRELCMKDEEFYRDILETFLDSYADIELNRCYEAADWIKYRIKVHSMKSNLSGIGAKKASEMAKHLELAAKDENDISYVREHHEEFLSVYRNVISEVERYLEADSSSATLS